MYFFCKTIKVDTSNAVARVLAGEHQGSSDTRASAPEAAQEQPPAPAAAPRRGARAARGAPGGGEGLSHWGRLTLGEGKGRLLAEGAAVAGA